MKHILFALILLLTANVSFAQKRQKKPHTPQAKNTVKVAASHPKINCYTEKIVVENVPLVFKDYTCKIKFKSHFDVSSDKYIFINVEWPSEWGDYDIAPLQKALLSWIQSIWKKDRKVSTRRFNSVEDVLNTFYVEGDKTFLDEFYFNSYNFAFECCYISSDVCIYEFNNSFGDFFYYDIKNNKTLSLYDLISSKSEAVNSIVNELNRKLKNNTNYSKDYFKDDIDSLRANGIKDLLLDKEQITFFSEHREYVVPLSQAMPALTDRAKEIIKNMPARETGLEDVTSSRPVVSVLKFFKSSDDLSYYTDRDVSYDSNGDYASVYNYSQTKFRFTACVEGDEWDYFVPKSKVNIDKYAINNLLLSDIGDRITFASDDGKHKVQIIKYNKNGHKFIDSYFQIIGNKSYSGSGKNEGNYILCYEIKDNGVWFAPLEVEGDHVRLTNFGKYKNDDFIFGNDNYNYNIFNSRPDYEPNCYFIPGYYTISSFFDENGTLICDMPKPVDDYEGPGGPFVMTVAYLHDRQQLYFPFSGETNFLNLVKSAKKKAAEEAAKKKAAKEAAKKKELERKEAAKKKAAEEAKKKAAEEAAKKKAAEEAAKKKAAEEAAKRKAAEEAKKPIIHTVSDGENLTKIAKRYGVSVQDIKKLNNITDESKVRSGSTLKIPKKLSAETEEVYSSAAHMPSFPGGDDALMKYLSSHIRYPEAAAKNNIQGKVLVQMVIRKDGSVGEVRIARSVCEELDREAIRVCKSLPKFTPGRNAIGDLVNAWYTLPVTFKLQCTN